MDIREIQESREALWQFLDVMAGAAILAWAARHGLDGFVVPAHPDWPRGLVVFTDPAGIHHGLPLDTQGRASRFQEIFFAEGAWIDLGRLCADQSQKWADLVRHWDIAG